MWMGVRTSRRGGHLGRDAEAGSGAAGAGGGEPEGQRGRDHRGSQWECMRSRALKMLKAARSWAMRALELKGSPLYLAELKGSPL